MKPPTELAARIEAEAKEYSQKVHDQIGHEKHRHLKTIAFYSYKEATEKYLPRLERAEESNTRLETIITVQDAMIKDLEEQMEKMAKALQVALVSGYGLECTVAASQALTDYNIYIQAKE